jgi:glycosyltransferase involved in cell wall biosynthesis/O-antigen/teichoic acid export membrane protein
VSAGGPRHLLVLTDRDWTHPEGGGTGTVLYGLVSRWLAAGHRVTMIAGSYPGAEAVSRPHEHLEIHRMGTRLTVFPRAALATMRGVGRDADVLLEVCNGIAFFSTLWRWLRVPRALLVFHVHQEHYVTELGWRGRLGALFAERLPLRHLYPGVPVLTISRSSYEDLVELGIERDRLHVVYLGLDRGEHLVPGPKAPEPTLIYLGRLKQYKRIEHVLDVLEAVPGAHLDVAGDGDHRRALEDEVARRGLRPRVTFHGHVSEERKGELLRRAWVSLSASSAEGWSLAVFEAGACGTPTAALAVGGLREAIVDGETGVLARTPAELASRVAQLVEQPERLRAMGAAAEARARGFTWDATAERTLAVLETTREVGPARRPRLREALARSESGKAAGLAAATLLNNAIQLVFTVVFTRLLGKSGYGSLAALISAFLILLVAGQAAQVAAAREVALDRLGDPARLRATLRAWTARVLTALVAVAGAAVLLRDPLARLIGVPTHPWAAAAIPVTGCLWLLVSLQRGALQGLRVYAPVGLSIIAEALGRLVCGLILVGAGLGVTGALLGTPLAFALVALGLARVLARELGPVTGPTHPSRESRTMRSLVGDGWVPIVGLFLVATLQNVDVIVGKHELGSDAAGSYAAAAVAAKAVIWVAIGLGLHLLPEATRRAAAGLDPRPVLLRALGILAVVALPALAIFAAAPRLLLRVAFGPSFTQASGALLLLGAAMTLLAVAYLTVQYMLALGEARFLWVLGVIAIAEPVILSTSRLGIVGFAAIVFGAQCVAASSLLAFGLRARRAAA